MTASTLQTDKKPKRKAPKTAWKPGQSGNPAGRQKDEHSWKEVISDVSNMTVEDILIMVGETNDLGRAIKAMPKKVQMKYLVTARVMAALMFEPTSGLWNGLMDRMEGKVVSPVDVTSNGERIGQADDARASIQRKLAEIARTTSGSSVPEPVE